MVWWIQNAFFELWISKSKMHISIMDWWIRNGFFELWTSKSKMHILNYGLVDPKFYRKHQSETFSDSIIQNAKK